MDKLEVLDTIHDLIVKLEYLTNAHCGYLSLVNKAYVVSERDMMGFSNVFNEFIDELKTFEKELNPLIK